jgi:hypothetical protein
VELVEDHWIDDTRYAATAYSDPARHKVLDREVRVQDCNGWDEKGSRFEFHRDALCEDELPVFVQREVVIMPKKSTKQPTRTKVWEVTCIAEGPLATPMTKEKERIDGGYAANVC